MQMKVEKMKMKLYNSNKTIEEFLKNKKVLYIATKNFDYIRISQEMGLIKKYSQSTDLVISDKKNYFHRCLDIYLKLLFTNVDKYDIVFVGFMAQMIILPFYWKIHRKIIIVDFFISVYDTLVFDRKVIKQKSWCAHLLKRIDRLTLSRAQMVIADTVQHKIFFSREFAIEENKIQVLYLAVDDDIYYPRKQVKESQWVNKYLVLYFGSILPLQGIEIILQAIKEIEEPNISFLIIGPVKDTKEIRNLPNVTHIQWVSQKQLAEYISEADLCLAGHFSMEIEKARRTIPGKAYIYSHMEKAIILGENPANHELFSEGQSGIHFVKMGDSAELRNKILTCYKEYLSHE